MNEIINLLQEAIGKGYVYIGLLGATNLATLALLLKLFLNRRNFDFKIQSLLESTNQLSGELREFKKENQSPKIDLSPLFEVVEMIDGKIDSVMKIQELVYNLPEMSVELKAQVNDILLKARTLSSEKKKVYEEEIDKLKLHISDLTNQLMSTLNCAKSTPSDIKSTIKRVV